MRILLLNQAFHPDVVSTAQHLSDFAAVLYQGGHEVTAIASDRAYDKPDIRFPRREIWRGVRILRVRCLGLGKGATWRRAFDYASFLISCAFQLARTQRQDVVVALTTPPLIVFLGALFVSLKGGRLVYWVMDLNPDEAIAAGLLSENSLTARILGRILKFGLSSSHTVVALDRYMEQRLLSKGVPESKLAVVAPWPHDDIVQPDLDGREAFRRENGIDSKFVVMYSGNHSPCHPLTTVIEAARELRDDPNVAFCFVGGGSEHTSIRRFAEQHRLTNVHCLPYQPLDRLAGSLSAADLHVVAMGPAFVGIVHPCKIYNILRLGKPVLYIGPRESHIVDLMRSAPDEAFFAAEHGDVNLVVKNILRAATRQQQTVPGPWLDQKFTRDALVAAMLASVVNGDHGDVCVPTESKLQAGVYTSMHE